MKKLRHALASQKEQAINSLRYKKMLILNPLCNLGFLRGLFYVQYLNFCPFLDGQIEGSNPLVHQTDVFAFQAKWNLMNFFSSLPTKQ